MNILYLATHLNTGGITSYLLSLGVAMRERGHRVFLAAAGGEMENDLRQSGVDFIPIPIKTKSELSPNVVLSFFQLRARAREMDIVHANTRVTQVLAALLGRPYVVTCHGFFRRRFSRLIYPCWGRRVIAISAQVKEHLLRDFGVPEKKIALIPHGIDVGRFLLQAPSSKLQAKAVFSLGSGPVIGIIARLSEVKGHIHLLRAFPRLSKEFPAAQLFIVGEGREKERLEQEARGLGVPGQIVFLPRTGDTSKALAAMDIFVMPSLQEGLGLALMEAMAAGLPVVASNIGGIKTLIENENNGVLVEPGRPEELAEAIAALLREPARAAEMGQRARQFIAENFSRAKMARQTEEVYRQCLGAKG
jgi:glycosyltransferase involved in cell wall biosynthesis